MPTENKKQATAAEKVEKVTITRAEYNALQNDLKEATEALNKVNAAFEDLKGRYIRTINLFNTVADKYIQGN